MSDLHSGGGGPARERNQVPDKAAQAVGQGRDLQVHVVEPVLRRAARGLLHALRAAIVRAVSGRRSRRKSTAALLSLNDRMLADIGLRRGDVQGIAYGVIPVEQVVPAARSDAAGPMAQVSPLRAKEPPAQDAPAPYDAAA